MKTLISCLLALALLLPGGALAEEMPMLLEEDGLRLALDGWQSAAGEVVLRLCCDNDTGAPVSLTLIAPEINGELAAFERGWGTDALELPEGRSRAEFIMEPDDEDEVPERLCLRLVLNGRVSSPLGVDLSGPSPQVTAASFALGAREPQMVEPTLPLPGDAAACRRTLTDTLSPEETAMLDYGYAAIYLRTTDETGELLTELGTVQADVDENGVATAEYSGLALVLADDPGIPIPTLEPIGEPGAPRVITSRSFALSGELIYFASMEVSLQPDGGAARVSMAVTSEELGGRCVSVPCALFERVQTSTDVWRSEYEAVEIHLQNADSLGVRADITAPLRLMLVPAESLGEVVVCFNYFFLDDSDVIRLPQPLD